MKKKLLLGLALGAMVMTTACGQAKDSNKGVIITFHYKV